MRIAMVSEHANPLAALGGADAGGQNVHVAALSAALSRHGHRVDVYTRRDDPDVPERVIAPEGYTVVHVPAGPPRPVPKDDLLPYMGQFGGFLHDEWAQTRPDVTHAHFWMSGVATQLAAKKLNLPALQTFHALGVVKRRYQKDQDTSPRERLTLEKLVAREATWVAATCTDEVFELMRLGRERSRISVVPCGVDLKLFRPDGRAAARRARPRIVSVGRFVQRKGFDVMIRALQWIPDAELVIVGGPDKAALRDDSEAQRLLALARELGVAKRVRLYGSVERADMPAVLRSADVVACTPWYEPFGIVPLEAMACGVPVVASAVGGMLDTVVDGVTGRLVPPRRPDLLADVLNELLADDTRRRAMGEAGCHRAQARYSWDRVAAETLRIYDRLAASGFWFDARPSRPRALSG